VRRIAFYNASFLESFLISSHGFYFEAFLGIIHHALNMIKPPCFHPEFSMQSVSFRPYASAQNSRIVARSTFGEAQTHLVKETTDALFNRDVIEASKKQPVLVMFHASWCGPCKEFAKRADKLAQQYQGRVQITKVLASDYAHGKTFPVNDHHFQQYGGVTYPTIMLFVNGQPQPVFKYYARQADGSPQRQQFIPGQTTGIPSMLGDHQFTTLFDNALASMKKLQPAQPD
jgi:thiol-disulfide isomerase/thioredoxin